MPSMTRGDWVGFTFNGVHSSELGFIRVSDGSRFNETVLPTMKDITVQVPGENGTYYFGSYYTQKPFNFNIAFDTMTESQFRKMRQVFGDGQIHDLILDEAPYKVYSVKVSTPPQLKYICFDENEKRIYKGEGTIQFIAHYPFAHGRWKPGEEIITEEATLAYENSSNSFVKYNPTSSTISMNSILEGGWYIEKFGYVYFSPHEVVRFYDPKQHNKTIFPPPHLMPFTTRKLIPINDTNKQSIAYKNELVKDYLKGKKIYKIKNGIDPEEVYNYFEWYDTYLNREDLYSDAWNIMPLAGKSQTYGYTSCVPDSDKGKIHFTINMVPNNIGDIDGDFILNLYFPEIEQNKKIINSDDVSIRLELLNKPEPNEDTIVYNKLCFTAKDLVYKNKGLVIDTKKKLITRGGVVKNNWITEGDFFKIPANRPDIRFRIYMTFSYDVNKSINISNNFLPVLYEWNLKYDYLYY